MGVIQLWTREDSHSTLAVTVTYLHLGAVQSEEITVKLHGVLTVLF